MKKFESIKNEYVERYANDNSDDAKNVVGLFEKASGLSDAAKREFLEVFDFTFAIDGEVYIGGKRSKKLYPHLVKESEDLGIKIITR